MSANSDRFERALAAIDAANAADPTSLQVQGKLRPKELVHSEMATSWVIRLCPEPSEELLLAARGHHLRRWTSPRSDYPTGRGGYLRWRRDLRDRHARELALVLAAAGYDSATAERVGQIVRKRDLGTDPEVQVLEDALCLVFLETQLNLVAPRFEADKLIDVLAKTSAKMSDQGVAAARALELDPVSKDLLRRAIARAGRRDQ